MKTWAILLFSLLAGCASVKPAPPLAPLFADSAFGAPSEPVGTEQLFTLSPEMRAHLNSREFRAHLRRRGDEQGLVDALYQKSGLKIEYDSSVTRNAAQTYAARAGNCLSLVIMTAAFAKELGLRIRYQSVDMDLDWSRKAGLYLASAHVNLSLGPRSSDISADAESRFLLTIDFVPPENMRTYRTHQLEEAEIAAMYMNNRAAEALLQGRLDDAYWWTRAALAKAPSSVMAYNTLGVVYQRHGNSALSEQVLRAALEREPENLMVMQNLVPVLDALGKTGEAQALQRRVASLQPHPPFHFFHLGMAALNRGDFKQAKALFEREVARAPYNDEFHFWLAIACLNLGEHALARKQLALAVDTSPTEQMRGRYSSKLAQLASRAGLN